MGLELVKNPDICILEKEREKVRMKRGESKSSIWYCTHTHTQWLLRLARLKERPESLPCPTLTLSSISFTLRVRQPRSSSLRFGFEFH